MDIGRKLAELEARLARMENSPRLSHAAIDNTSVEVRDSAGGLRGLIGVQADGTTAVNVVNGPPPPQPTVPLLTSVLGGITASWDGTFDGGATLPLDWQRTEVHASGAGGFTPGPDTLKGTIETPQGSTVVVATDTPVYVRLLARSTSGTASAASGQAGPLGPTQVVADELLDGIVTRSKIAENAVTINALTESLADTASQRYVDAMGDPTAWTVLSTTAGTAWQFLTGVADAPTGSTVAQAIGFTVARGTIQLPYDPDVLYRVSARVRTTAASASGTDTLYLGVLGIAADGVTYVNRSGANSYFTQHQPAASNASQPSSSGWVTYTGYIRGRAASGTATTSPDPRTPGVVHNDVRFISPLVYLNFGSGTSGSSSTTGTMQVDAFTIEALKTGVVGSSNLVAGSVTTAALAADSVTATQILAGSVTAAKIDAGAVTTAKLDALAVTSDKIAANAVTVGKLAAGSVDATAIAADAITGKTITGGTITGAVVQTAETGQRITLNEGDANMILVYNAAGTAIGELSAAGLLVKGTGGAVLSLDPNQTYPNLRLTNAAQSNSAIINVVETTTGAADLGLNTGTFTANGFTDMTWRTFMGNDFAVIERYSKSNPTTNIGGRLDLRATTATMGYYDDTGATPAADLVFNSGLAHMRARTLIQPSTGTNNTVLFLQPGPSHTGYILRYYDPDAAAYRFSLDKTGNLAVGGILSAGNIAAGRVTITPSAANTPTSANVTGLNLKGTNIRVSVSPGTSVPGTQVTGVGFTNVTSDGFTVWLTRTNTTATGIDWIAYGV